MTGNNEYKIVIDLPTSDGFHTKNDRHLAEIVGDQINRLLKSRSLPQGSGVRYVRSNPAPRPSIKPVEALNAIEVLLALHEGSDWDYSLATQQLKKILAAAKTPARPADVPSGPQAAR